MVRCPRNPTFSQEESLWKTLPPAFLSRVNDKVSASVWPAVSGLLSACAPCAFCSFCFFCFRLISGAELMCRRPALRTWCALQRPRMTRPSKCFRSASGLKSMSWSPVRSWDDEEGNFLGGVSNFSKGLDGWDGAERRSGVLSKVYSNLWNAHGYEYFNPPYCERLEWGNEFMAKETATCYASTTTTPYAWAWPVADIDDIEWLAKLTEDLKFSAQAVEPVCKWLQMYTMPPKELSLPILPGILEPEAVASHQQSDCKLLHSRCPKRVASAACHSLAFSHAVIAALQLMTSACNVCNHWNKHNRHNQYNQHNQQLAFTCITLYH